ncbi:MAG: hypothetical protein JKX72_10275, partial [Robiginitomaculum sp.]|nr:hypothetical protein [Robiginitomaculum sp.]
MNIRRYILSASLPVLAIAMPISALAQVEITDAQTTGINTSTSGNNAAPSDVTITATGSVVVTTGAAVTVDSDNAVINDGSITSLDADDTTGILISGNRTGTITNNNLISLTETVPTDDLALGADIAVGSGRVGILISGASQFIGNIENSSTGQIIISGQDSSGIKLAALSSVTGNINQNGRITVFGERSTGLDIIGDVIGNLAVNGAIVATGEDASAIKVSGDVTGSLKVTSLLSGTGYLTATRIQVGTRPTTAGLILLNDTGSVRQAGSVVQINGNIGQGIHFAELRSDTDVLISVASVAMIGSAPAILIDGNGTPIAIGRVGQITDPNNADFDADLQYAFVNQGTLLADGLLDDISATTFSLRDATLEGGINNTRTMRATVYRSGIDPAATA